MDERWRAGWMYCEGCIARASGLTGRRLEDHLVKADVAAAVRVGPAEGQVPALGEAVGLTGVLVVRVRIGVVVEAGARGWVPVVGVQARDGRGLAGGELGGVIGGMAVRVRVVGGSGGLRNYERMTRCVRMNDLRNGCGGQRARARRVGAWRAEGRRGHSGRHCTRHPCCQRGGKHER